MLEVVGILEVVWVVAAVGAVGALQPCHGSATRRRRRSSHRRNNQEEEKEDREDARLAAKECNTPNENCKPGNHARLPCIPLEALASSCRSNSMKA